MIITLHLVVLQRRPTIIEVLVHFQGRPIGGLANLAHHRVAHACRSVAVNDRYSLIAYGDILLCNVYLTCRGTSDLATFAESILQEVD